MLWVLIVRLFSIFYLFGYIYFFRSGNFIYFGLIRVNFRICLGCWIRSIVCIWYLFCDYEDKVDLGDIRGEIERNWVIDDCFVLLN